MFTEAYLHLITKAKTVQGKNFSIDFHFIIKISLKTHERMMLAAKLAVLTVRHKTFFAVCQFQTY